MATRTGDLPELRRMLRKLTVSNFGEVAASNVVRYLADYPDIFNHIFLKRRLKEFLAYFPFKLVYLPTYRRVEEDLANLGISGLTDPDDAEWEDLTANGDVLIHFGMRDVRDRFARITQRIKDDTMASYSKISGGMLDELLRMSNFSKEMTLVDHLRENEDGLTLVLKRIGTSISDLGRNRILDLVKTGEISQNKYQPLAYFLMNLIKIYESQKGFDEKINRFVETANNYLSDKKLVYNEVDPSIVIRSVRSKDESRQIEIDLDTLSSGEKQLISILSLFYLEENDFALIFDEPELSLSTGWQQKLLPDLMSSGNCKFLLAATHSPYIFDNEYFRYAKPINVTYEEAVDVTDN
jgi:hypothetical protein